jgi:hypothetical protein
MDESRAARTQSICVVMPAFNAARTLERTVARQANSDDFVFDTEIIAPGLARDTMHRRGVRRSRLFQLASAG